MTSSMVQPLLAMARQKLLPKLISDVTAVYSTNDKVSIVEQSHLFWSSLISKHFITSLHHDSLASYVPHCQTPPNPTNPPVQTPWPRQNHPVSYPLQSPLPFFRPHVTLPYRGLLTGAVRPGATQHSPHQ